MHVNIIFSTTASSLEYSHSNIEHQRIMAGLVVPETSCLSGETHSLTKIHSENHNQEQRNIQIQKTLTKKKY